MLDVTLICEMLHGVLIVVISRAHSFPRAANFNISAEFEK